MTGVAVGKDGAVIVVFEIRRIKDSKRNGRNCLFAAKGFGFVG